MSVDASSITDFSNHSALRSIMTNYDYTKYDASAARREELKAVLAAAELGDYDSILMEDGGFAIHKSRPIAEEDDEAEDDDNHDDELNTPKSPVEEWDSAMSKGFSANRKKTIERKQQKVNKSPGSKVLHLLFRGKKSKGGINTNKEDVLDTTPETDASSRQFDPSPFSNESFSNETKTPLVTNASVSRRTPALVGVPPIIPVISPHIAPRKERALQLLRKINAIKEDEGSASTARLTDEDTSEGDANSSTCATREPRTKESTTKNFDSFCAVNDAAKKIFRENIVNYNSFFSLGCGHVSVARTSSTPFDEAESNSGIEPTADEPVQPNGCKESSESVPGLACINKFDTRKLSHDFYDGSLCDTRESSSFDTIDSLIRKESCAPDPCGIGGLMEEINDAIQNIANVFDSNENRTAEGRNSNHGQNTESYSSDDESNKSRRQTDVLHLRYKHVKNRNMLT
jgi:hypothetical protein